MSKSLAVLERMSIEDNTMAQFWGDLPEKAANALGYEALQKRKQHVDLMSLLDKMKIRPFTDRSVERYKEKVVRETNPRLWRRQRFVEVMAIISVIACFFCGGPAILGWFISWKVGLPFAAGLATFATIFGILGSDQFSYMRPGSWQITPLKGYMKPVPEFALHCAVQIKEQLPEAEFSIHEFVQEKGFLDPFLVVSYKGEHHYIAVWDEPTFDAKKKI